MWSSMYQISILHRSNFSSTELEDKGLGLQAVKDLQWQRGMKKHSSVSVSLDIFILIILQLR